MVMNILSINEIVSDPKVRSGRPVIRGTGITVMTIVFAHTTGDKLTLEQIAEDYRLPFGQVLAAMAYYYLHQEEMDAQAQRESEETTLLLAELERQGKLTRHD
ncbi:MAG: DUF433 domain-containing protein [Chloroflexi bacterium]|nr:DUF433 domain-containing protein [Chloroflexota bacterium]MCC6895943.1 DUF433 domain-containing protein [Anaerolineae bacterium]